MMNRKLTHLGELHQLCREHLGYCFAVLRQHDAQKKLRYRPWSLCENSRLRSCPVHSLWIGWNWLFAAERSNQYDKFSPHLSRKEEERSRKKGRRNKRKKEGTGRRRKKFSSLLLLPPSPPSFLFLPFPPLSLCLLFV